MIMKKHIQTTITLLLSISLISCSDNSTSSDDTAQGSATFSVSGDLQGSRSGTAEFPGVDSTLDWDLWIYSLSNGGFSLDIRIFFDREAPGPPPTGTYSIGDHSADGTAEYSEFTSGAIPQIFSTKDGGGYGGTITINESNNDVVRGTFQFTAGRWNESTESFTGEINITNGNFTARRERF
ncbi:MAG: hypothetical protein EA359_07530 [Balneolaceae bacterium]|nr:MAG: hypothetical protein EA359_07530 [Balneolaceae bacterium]